MLPGVLVAQRSIEIGGGDGNRSDDRLLTTTTMVLGFCVLLSSLLAARRHSEDGHTTATTNTLPECVGIRASDRFPTVVTRLAQQLNSPVVDSQRRQRRQPQQTDPSSEISHILSVEPWDDSTSDDAYAIGISHVNSAKTNKPFIVDYCPSRTGSRLGQRAAQGNDLLLQAIGSHQQSIVDATAGWGADAWIMAQSRSSHVVHMVERNPIVATLVQDALRRFPDTDPVKERLFLTVGDFCNLPTTTTIVDSPDVVYLDPMFPPRKKKALVKKNMQMLHSLLSSQDEGDVDHTDLFAAAMCSATARVVVKRPIHAAWLVADAKPSFAVTGPTSRWDVYLVQ